MYPTIHRRWKYFQFIVQTAENGRQKFAVWRNVVLNLSNNNNIQATISVFRLVKNMSINVKSVEFHQCHAKPHSICFFTTISKITKETKEIFVKICWQLNTNLDLKVHALHYANELLVRVRLSIQKLLQTRSTWRNNTKKMYKSTDHDKPHFHSSVFMFFTTISTSKKMCFFFFRARAEKGIARHIDASSVVWTLVIFDWFVLSMRMQVILDSLFARPGSAPIGGGKKREFRDWTTVFKELGRSDGAPGETLRSLLFAAASHSFVLSVAHVRGRPNSIAMFSGSRSPAGGAVRFSLPLASLLIVHLPAVPLL